MNLLQPNVVGFDNKSVHSSIMTFLEYKGDKSTNTREAYERDIKYFFTYMKNKDLTQLTEDDLWFEKEDVIRYRNHLKNIKIKSERKYSNTTINRMIASMRSLFNFFDKFKVNEKAFRIDKLPSDSEEIGYLTLDEMVEMVEQARDLSRGLEKSLFLELGYKTSIRLEALLTVTVRNFKKVSDDIYLVCVKDKNNKVTSQPISNQFYQRLMQLKTSDDKDERLFKFSNTTVQDTINTLKDRMNIDPERNVSFHSVRKVLIDWMIEQGDLKGAAAHAGHASIETTWKHYANKHRDYSQMAGILVEQQLDVSLLEQMSKEDLVELIKQDRGVLSKVLNMIKVG